MGSTPFEPPTIAKSSRAGSGPPRLRCRRRTPLAHRVSRPNPVERSATVGAESLPWRPLCYAFEAAPTDQNGLCGWFATASFEPRYALHARGFARGSTYTAAPGPPEPFCYRIQPINIPIGWCPPHGDDAARFGIDLDAVEEVANPGDSRFERRVLQDPGHLVLSMNGWPWSGRRRTARPIRPTRLARSMSRIRRLAAASSCWRRLPIWTRIWSRQGGLVGRGSSDSSGIDRGRLSCPPDTRLGWGPGTVAQDSVRPTKRLAPIR